MDLLTRIALAFSNEIFLVPIVVFGFLSGNKRIFGNGLIILLFSMIFNSFLKGLFQVPLHPAIGAGYAFPSGHMQASFVFYGWIFLHFKSILLRRVIPFIIVAIGYSLIYQGYHTFADVIAAIGFGVITLAIYYPLTTKPLFIRAPFILGAVLAVLSSAFIMYTWVFSHVSSHIWLAVCVLCSFTMSWAICDSSMPIRLPLRAGAGTFLLLIGLYAGFALLEDFVHIGDEIHWVLSGLLLPISSKIAASRIRNEEG